MGTRKYEIEVVTTTYTQQLAVDAALESLAAQGIWVHSNRESDTTDGCVLKPINVANIYAGSREV